MPADKPALAADVIVVPLLPEFFARGRIERVQHGIRAALPPASANTTPLTMIGVRGDGMLREVHARSSVSAPPLSTTLNARDRAADFGENPARAGGVAPRGHAVVAEAHVRRILRRKQRRSMIGAAKRCRIQHKQAVCPTSRRHTSCSPSLNTTGVEVNADSCRSQSFSFSVLPSSATIELRVVRSRRCPSRRRRCRPAQREARDGRAVGVPHRHRLGLGA